MKAKNRPTLGSVHIESGILLQPKRIPIFRSGPSHYRNLNTESVLL